LIPATDCELSVLTLDSASGKSRSAEKQAPEPVEMTGVGVSGTMAYAETEYVILFTSTEVTKM